MRYSIVGDLTSMGGLSLAGHAKDWRRTSLRWGKHLVGNGAMLFMDGMQAQVVRMYQHPNRFLWSRSRSRSRRRFGFGWPSLRAFGVWGFCARSWQTTTTSPCCPIYRNPTAALQDFLVTRCLARAEVWMVKIGQEGTGGEDTNFVAFDCWSTCSIWSNCLCINFGQELREPFYVELGKSKIVLIKFVVAISLQGQKPYCQQFKGIQKKGRSTVISQRVWLYLQLHLQKWMWIQRALDTINRAEIVPAQIIFGLTI